MSPQNLSRALSLAAAGACGFVAWSGHVLVLPISSGLSLIYLCQTSRQFAYLVALAYYLAASWALVPGSLAFFASGSFAKFGLVLWITSSIILALPWGLAFRASWPGRFVSVPWALTLTTIPPVGLIGWASPLTGAGVLFPGTGLWGVLAVSIWPAIVVRNWKVGIGVAAGSCVLAHLAFPGDPPPITAWEAVNTHLGRIEASGLDPLKMLLTIEAVQQRSIESQSKLMLFPEGIASQWNAATDALWNPGFNRLAQLNRVVAFGATMPMANSKKRLNALVFRGATRPIEFVQRIPPPISMWRPFSSNGYPLRLNGPATVEVSRRRLGVLICYELLLAGPVLSQSFEHPDILLGVANDFWATGTPIAEVQRAALSSWSRLFWIPHLLAANT